MVRLLLHMVEAGGIEPPSASDPQSGATFLVDVLSCELLASIDKVRPPLPEVLFKPVPFREQHGPRPLNDDQPRVAVGLKAIVQT